MNKRIFFIKKTTAADFKQWLERYTKDASADSIPISAGRIVLQKATAVCPRDTAACRITIGYLNLQRRPDGEEVLWLPAGTAILFETLRVPGGIEVEAECNIAEADNYFDKLLSRIGTALNVPELNQEAGAAEKSTAAASGIDEEVLVLPPPRKLGRRALDANIWLYGKICQHPNTPVSAYQHEWTEQRHKEGKPLLAHQDALRMMNSAIYDRKKKIMKSAENRK